MADENKEKPANAGEMQGIRDEKGRFIEGVSGNPEGKIKGTKNYLTQLEEAIEKYETEKGKKLFDRLIQRAFISDNVLMNVIKKFIPDKQHIQTEEIEPIKLIVEHVRNKDKGN